MQARVLCPSPWVSHRTTAIFRRVSRPPKADANPKTMQRGEIPQSPAHPGKSQSGLGGIVGAEDGPEICLQCEHQRLGGVLDPHVGPLLSTELQAGRWAGGALGEQLLQTLIRLQALTVVQAGANLQGRRQHTARKAGMVGGRVGGDAATMAKSSITTAKSSIMCTQNTTLQES